MPNAMETSVFDGYNFLFLAAYVQPVLLIVYKECLYVFLAWSGLLQDGMAAHGLHIGCTELTVAAHGLHVLGMAAQWLHTCSQMAALIGCK